MSTKKIKSYIFLCFCLISFLSAAQTINGVVLDAKTKVPIETATIYFDNTTKGTITNKQGKFSISYSKAIRSPLVISFLGYEKQIITDYRKRTHITIFLEESHEALDEVVIDANDGMSRKQKLKYFKREFLGSSRFANACSILNENDIILRYNKKERILTGYSKAPLKIKNKALQYLVNYDVTSFMLKFYPLNSEYHPFDTETLGFVGTTFYKDLEIFDKKKAIKNRAKAYGGSRLQFIRALYAMKLEERGYQLYDGKTKIEPQNYFNYFYMNLRENTGIKRLSMIQPINILYKSWEKSSIELLVPSIFIDYYGNYTNVNNVQFSGAMGEQRVGELLPFDYGL